MMNVAIIPRLANTARCPKREPRDTREAPESTSLIHPGQSYGVLRMLGGSLTPANALVSGALLTHSVQVNHRSSALVQCVLAEPKITPSESTERCGMLQQKFHCKVVQSYSVQDTNCSPDVCCL